MSEPTPTASASSDELSELELVTRVAGGDAGAYRVLSDAHLGPIYNYARRILNHENEAEDVAQETFLRLWTEAQRWKPTARLSTYLHRIAHNLCMDRLRRARPHSSDAVEALADSSGPLRLVERKQLAESVERALMTLPARQRAAVTMVHYQGLSNPEVADVLDIGVEAVESLLARGRRALREMVALRRATAGVSE